MARPKKKVCKDIKKCNIRKPTDVRYEVGDLICNKCNKKILKL